jgi:hypothetical protein
MKDVTISAYTLGVTLPKCQPRSTIATNLIFPFGL